jgi:L-2-hydroxyglutarate oxidase LhgO
VRKSLIFQGMMTVERMSEPSAKTDAVVVGAGVVGLAVARLLARSGREVVLLEAGAAIGAGISSRSSEVIHAGLYYPAGSAKARLCVRGNRLLYAFCEAHGVEHRACGKLVVATDEGQVEPLRALEAQARANGVPSLTLLSRAEVQALEPSLHAEAALLSNSTGIVDSHGLMQALLADAQQHRAVVALRSPALGGAPVEGGWVLEVGGEVPSRLQARAVVNCTGLGAPDLARRLQGIDSSFVPRAYHCKGSYFSLRGQAPFQRLVYPLHGPEGLGVHLTLDLAGRARFGPDAEWLEGDLAADAYTVDPARAKAFAAAIRRYWPGLSEGALEPAYAGVRPKLVGPEAAAADFRIDGPATHGVRGLVNLFGIESPGLTAALAIAEEVAGLLAD